MLPDSFWIFFDNLIYSSFMIEQFSPFFQSIHIYFLYFISGLALYLLFILLSDNHFKTMIPSSGLLLGSILVVFVYIRLVQKHDEKICESFGLKRYECSINYGDSDFPNKIILVVTKPRKIKNVYQLNEKRFRPQERQEKEYLYLALDTYTDTQDDDWDYFSETTRAFKRDRLAVKEKIDEFLKEESTEQVVRKE